MIKKIFLTFLLAFVCFFGINKVYASELDAEFYKQGSGSIPTFDFTFSSGSSLTGNFILTTPSLNASGVQGGAVKVQIYACSFSSQDYSLTPKANSVLQVSTKIPLDGEITMSFGPICRNLVLFESTGYINLTSSYSSGSLINFPIGFDVTGSAEFYVYKINYGYSKDFDDYTYNAIQEGFESITNQQQITNEKLDSVNNSIKDTNDTLKDDDTSESSSEYGDFFTGFNTNNHGLTGIITAPLELIGNLAGSSCSPLPLQVPFVNKTMSLPCMSTIYKKHFGNLFTIYQTITFGLISYWVMVKLFALIKGFKNPANDEIEVMDL